MSVDSSLIDSALIAKLAADATLLSYCPEGVFFAEAPQGAKRFVIVSLIDETDEGVFGTRAIEDALYLVEARLLKGASANADADAHAAATRIDALLEDQPLGTGSPPTVAGYAWMCCYRESRVRFTEVDAVDPALRWFRRGGQYRVQFSVSGA